MKKSKNSEETVSMFLGLGILITIIVLIFNFINQGNKEKTGQVPQEDGQEKSKIVENVDEQMVYTVSRDDSLWKIAEKEYGDGYKWVEIARENKIQNPGILYTGQKLILPKNEKKTDTLVLKQNEANKVEKGEYKVIRGDNLWKIAVKLYNDGYQWTKIWEKNKNIVKNPGKLEIGMVLMIE